MPKLGKLYSSFANHNNKGDEGVLRQAQGVYKQYLIWSFPVKHNMEHFLRS